MGIAIGFGTTEAEFEEAEERAFRAEIERLWMKEGRGYFTEELVAKFSEWLRKRAKEFHAKADQHRDADSYPARYSRYWPSVISDASHIVIILTIHHINRRHAMSPDGWAMLQRKLVLSFEALEMPERTDECGEAA